MSSSSSTTNCCGGSCGCGSACKCQTSCGDCKTNPDINNSTVIKSCHEGSETETVTSKHDGCKCGANCTCNPCTCK